MLLKRKKHDIFHAVKALTTHYNAATRATEENCINNFQKLQSNDISLQCDAITFFKNNIISANSQVVKTILLIGNSYDFDLLDCICPFFLELTSYPNFVKTCTYAQDIIGFFISLIQKSKENQFILDSFTIISNFTKYSAGVAEALFGINFINFSFTILGTLLKSLPTAEDDDVQFFDHLYLIEEILKLFSTIFIYPNLVTEEFATNVFSSYNALLNISNISQHSITIKGFVIENLYWPCINGPDISIKQIITPQFFESILILLKLKNDPMTESVFSTIFKITSHSDEFSHCFVQTNFLSVVNEFTSWNAKIVLNFCQILHNFAACEDKRVVDALLDPLIINFLKIAKNNGTYAIQKEVILIVCYIVNINELKYTNFVYNNMLDIFENIADFITNDDPQFIFSLLITICIFLNTAGVNEGFITLINNTDFENAISELTSDQDQDIAKLSADVLTFFDKI